MEYTKWDGYTSDYVYGILNSLNTNNIPWFFYENKQNRDITIMIKNLHHFYQPINVLHSLNDEALNATPKLKWKTEEPPNMFIVSFHQNTGINRILILQY
jgi:hypothetical protein